MKRENLQMNKRNYHIITICTFIICIVAMATGCQRETTSQESDKKRIVVWAWDEAFNIKAMQYAADDFTSKHRNVEIEIVRMSQDDIVSKINTALYSGDKNSLPNIVLIEDYRIQKYLTTYEDEFASFDDINKEAFESYKTTVNVMNDKLYGIPFDSGVAALYYRKDILEKAGYSQADMENLTWEKYIQIGIDVKEKTGTYMLTLDPSDLGEIRMMLQSAGAWYTDKDGSINIANNQALKDAIHTYKQIIEADIAKQIPDWDHFVGALHNEEVASIATGSWILTEIQTAKEQSGTWAVTQFPRMEQNKNSVNASCIGGAGWYVLKKAGNTGLSKEFLKTTFGSNTELMNRLVEEIGLVNVLNAAKDVTNYSQEVDFFDGQKIFQDLSNWQKDIPIVNYGEYTYEIEHMMTDAIQEIIAGQDTEEVLKEYQKKIEKDILP